jgi:hypothetical protein
VNLDFGAEVCLFLSGNDFQPRHSILFFLLSVGVLPHPTRGRRPILPEWLLSVGSGNIHAGFCRVRGLFSDGFGFSVPVF